MLSYDVPAWRALPWWQRQVYTEGLRWEIGNFGLYPQLVTDRPAGGGASEQQFIALDSMEARAAEGISTGVIYQQ